MRGCWVLFLDNDSLDLVPKQQVLVGPKQLEQRSYFETQASTDFCEGVLWSFDNQECWNRDQIIFFRPTLHLKSRKTTLLWIDCKWIAYKCNLIWFEPLVRLYNTGYWLWSRLSLFMSLAPSPQELAGTWWLHLDKLTTALCASLFTF